MRWFLALSLILTVPLFAERNPTDDIEALRQAHVDLEKQLKLYIDTKDEAQRAELLKSIQALKRLIELGSAVPGRNDEGLVSNLVEVEAKVTALQEKRPDGKPCLEIIARKDAEVFINNQKVTLEGSNRMVAIDEDADYEFSRPIVRIEEPGRNAGEKEVRAILVFFKKGDTCKRVDFTLWPAHFKGTSVETYVTVLAPEEATIRYYSRVYKIKKRAITILITDIRKGEEREIDFSAQWTRGNQIESQQWPFKIIGGRDNYIVFK